MNAVQRCPFASCVLWDSREDYTAKGNAMPPRKVHLLPADKSQRLKYITGAFADRAIAEVCARSTLGIGGGRMEDAVAARDPQNWRGNHGQALEC